jgi:hypothetical protein
MTMNQAQFFLGLLLYLFVMLDLTVTSIGIYDRHVASEASPLLSIYIQHTGYPIADGLILGFGGLITTGLMLALCFLVTKIQKVFSMEFFCSALIIFHFMGILSWIMILK